MARLLRGMLVRAMGPCLQAAAAKLSTCQPYLIALQRQQHCRLQRLQQEQQEQICQQHMRLRGSTMQQGAVHKEHMGPMALQHFNRVQKCRSLSRIAALKNECAAATVRPRIS